MASLTRLVVPRAGALLASRSLLPVTPAARFVSSASSASGATATTPSPTPPASSVKTSSHWKAERAVGIAFLGLIPVAAVAPSLPVDMALAIVIPLHNHWGLEQVITDYVHGKATLFLAHNGLKVLTLATLVGLVYFNLSDVGITQAVKMLWTI